MEGQCRRDVQPCCFPIHVRPNSAEQDLQHFGRLPADWWRPGQNSVLFELESIICLGCRARRHAGQAVACRLMGTRQNWWDLDAVLNCDTIGLISFASLYPNFVNAIPARRCEVDAKNNFKNDRIDHLDLIWLTHLQHHMAKAVSPWELRAACPSRFEMTQCWALTGKAWLEPG